VLAAHPHGHSGDRASGLESFNEGSYPETRQSLTASFIGPPEPVELVRWDVRPFPAQRREHLIQDLVSPLSLDQAGLANADQQVPQRVE
jgi:hypothetical protein